MYMSKRYLLAAYDSRRNSIRHQRLI